MLIWMWKWTKEKLYLMFVQCATQLHTQLIGWSSIISETCQQISIWLASRHASVLLHKLTFFFLVPGPTSWVPNSLFMTANCRTVELWHPLAVPVVDSTAKKYHQRCPLEAMALPMCHMNSTCLAPVALVACAAPCTPFPPLPLNPMDLFPATLNSLPVWRTPFPASLSHDPWITFLEISNQLIHPGFLAAPGSQKSQ